MKALNLSLAIVLAAFTSEAIAGDAAGKIPSIELTARTLERRAVDAAIWGMPMVSFDAMRQAFLRDGKAHYGDILYWSKFSTWKTQAATADPSDRYVIFFTNTKNGPVVIEVPPAGEAALAGTLLDAWQVPLIDVGPGGEDLGNGGKYLLLPPRYKGETPLGYIAVPSNTYNGMVALRVVPKSQQEDDVRTAIDYVKQLKSYPLAAADAPPEQRHIDMSNTLWDGIVRFDESFYASLARMVNEELSQARDLEMLGLLRPLGIEKGKRFRPNAATRALLKQASGEAHAWLMERLVNYGQPLGPGRKWNIPIPAIATETDFNWEAADYFDVEARGIGFFSFFAPSAQPRTSVFPLVAFSDARGERLRGEDNYRLHVPADVPAQQFWSFNVYDQETCGFIRGTMRVGLDSNDEQMKRNSDGSVDLYTGPQPPKGQQTNWIPTPGGKGWFALFRFYGPDEPLLQRAWKLPDIEKVR